MNHCFWADKMQYDWESAHFWKECIFSILGWPQLFFLSSCSRNSVVHKAPLPPSLPSVPSTVPMGRPNLTPRKDKKELTCAHHPGCLESKSQSHTSGLNRESKIRIPTLEDKIRLHKTTVRRVKVLTQLLLLWLNRCPYTVHLSQDLFPSRDVSPLGYKAIDQLFSVRKLQSSVCSYLMIERKGTF